MVPSSIYEPRAVIRLLDYLTDRVLLSMRAVPRRTIFCSSVILILPGILPIQFSVLFSTSPKAPMITGTVVVFISYVFSISITRSLYFVSFSVIFKVFLSVGIDIPISRQVLSFLSFTTMSGLFAFISLSVWICMSQSIVAVWFSITVAGSCSQCSSCTFMLQCLHIVQCRY